MLRIVIAEPYEVVRIGLKKALEAHLSCLVIAECPDLASLTYEYLAALDADLVISEVMFPHSTAFRQVRHLLKARPSLKVIFLTAHEQVTYHACARRCGSYALLYKHQSLAEILATIVDVAAGKRAFNDSPTVAPYSCLSAGTLSSQLSSREEDVVCCIAQGMKVKEIAIAFGVSQKTVEAHKANLMKKLNLHSQVALIRWAIGEGLILP